jgi:hypothetical protein
MPTIITAHMAKKQTRTRGLSKARRGDAACGLSARSGDESDAARHRNRPHRPPAGRVPDRVGAPPRWRRDLWGRDLSTGEPSLADRLIRWADARSRNSWVNQAAASATYERNRISPAVRLKGHSA